MPRLIVDPAGWRLRIRPWHVLGLRAVVTIGILAVLLTWLQPEGLLAAMKRTGLLLWVIVVLTHILAHLVVVAKWRILLQATGTETPVVTALRAHGAGLFGNLYLPSIVAGDVIRAGLLAPGGKNLSAIIAGGVADRVTDCISLIILSAIGLLWVPVAGTGINLTILTVAGSGVFVAVLGGAVAIKLVNPGRFSRRIASALSVWRQPIDTILRRKTTTLIAMVLSLSIQFFFVLQNVFIGRAIGIDVPIATWLVAWPLAKLASLTPLSLGGLGVREGVLAALLVPFSVPARLAVAESLVWQTVMYTLGLFGGIASIWIGQLRRQHQSSLTPSREIPFA